MHELELKVEAASWVVWASCLEAERTTTATGTGTETATRHAWRGRLFHRPDLLCSNTCNVLVHVTSCYSAAEVLSPTATIVSGVRESWIRYVGFLGTSRHGGAGPGTGHGARGAATYLHTYTSSTDHDTVGRKVLRRSAALTHEGGSGWVRVIEC